MLIFSLKIYNYDEEFVSIDDMMIEKNFIKEIKNGLIFGNSRLLILRAQKQVTL